MAITNYDEIEAVRHKAIEFIYKELIPIIEAIGEPLEGNLFCHHEQKALNPAWENKQRNVIVASSRDNIKHIFEIGFNAGFSALLMLLANPTATVFCVDINEHKYTMACYEKLREVFGNRINLLTGDSTKVVPTLVNTLKFDLIHIDGGHQTEVASSDITHCLMMAKKETIFIMDDTNFDNLNILWQQFVSLCNLVDVPNMTLYPTQDHSLKMIGSFVHQ